MTEFLHMCDFYIVSTKELIKHINWIAKRHKRCAKEHHKIRSTEFVLEIKHQEIKKKTEKFYRISFDRCFTELRRESPCD